MINVINLTDVPYLIHYSLKSIEAGIFNGLYRLRLHYRSVREYYGRVHWSDTLPYGFAFVDNNDYYHEYDMYLNDKKYTLGEFIENISIYYEYLDNYYKNQDVEELMMYLHLKGLKPLHEFVCEANKIYSFADNIIYTKCINTLYNLYLNEYLDYIEKEYKIDKSKKNEIRKYIIYKHKLEV